MASIQERVTAALLRGSSQITRRAEIFESDGATVFAGSDETPRIVSGDVTVDMSRDERRALDNCVFDNSDGVLKHNPDGFWYDKIIKIYRGISWYEVNEIPKIAVIYNNDTTLVPALRRLGFTECYDVAATTYGDVADYDIILVNGSTGAEASAAIYSILSTAFQAGKAIFTTGANTSANHPLISATISKSDSAAWVATPLAVEGPFTGRWTTITTSLTGTGLLPTSLTSNAVAVGTMTWSAVARTVAFYAQSAAVGRWFHIQTPYQNVTAYNQLLDTVVKWLYPTGGQQTWETQVGEFMIDRITEPRFPRTITVTGRDYTKRLLKSKFGSAVTFSSGTSIDTLIGAIAANGGVTKLNLNSENAVIESDISFDRTTERWAAIKGLADSASVDVYFNAAGYLTTRPMRDPSTSPASIQLATGPDIGNLVDYEKSSNDSRIYNRVIVTSENQDIVAATGAGLQVTAENNEPSSPTRISRLGERDYFYTSNFFTTEDQMTRYASKLLKIVALEEFELSFSAVPFFWSEAGDILDFVDPDPGEGEPDRFLLTNFSIPLGLGTMSGSGKRVTIVGAKATVDSGTGGGDGGIVDVPPSGYGYGPYGYGPYGG